MERQGGCWSEVVRVEQVGWGRRVPVAKDPEVRRRIWVR